MANTGRFLCRANRRPPRLAEVAVLFSGGGRTIVSPCTAACPAHHMRVARACKRARPVPDHHGRHPTPQQHMQRLMPLREAGALTLSRVLSETRVQHLHRLCAALCVGGLAAVRLGARAVQWAYLGSDYKRGWPRRPRRGWLPRGPSMCSQRWCCSMLRSLRSMLWLPLTASWWLLALMGLGSSGDGNVCGVGKAWAGVRVRGSRARALVSRLTATRDPAILTECSVFYI